MDVLAETAAGDVVRQYFRGARLATYRDVDTAGVQLYDHLGNTESLYDASQAVQAAYQYSAWGEGLRTTGGLVQSLQFGGDWGAWREGVSADLWMRRRG